MQDAGLGHGPLAVPDLDVTSDDQVMNLEGLRTNKQGHFGTAVRARM